MTEDKPALAQAYYQLKDLLRSEETDVRLPEDVDMDDCIEYTEYELVQGSESDELAIWEVTETEEHAKSMGSDDSQRRTDRFSVHLVFGHAEAGPEANVELGAESLNEKRKIA